MKIKEKKINNEIKQLLIYIQMNYDIGEIINYEEIDGWGGTLRFKLVSTKGKYFLKEKVNYLNSKEFKIKATINYYLYLYNLPVAPILERKDGKFISQYKRKYYELLIWITGVSLHQTPEDLKLLGYNMGLLQAKSKNILHKMGIHSSWKEPANRQKLFPDIPIFIKNYLNFFLNSKISYKFDLNLVNKIIILCEDLLSNIKWSKLSESWIHGDPGLDNVIVNYKKEMFLFDLDNFRYSYKVWDLARMASTIGGFSVINNSQKSLSSTWDKQNLVSNLIDGFNISNFLNSYEKEKFFSIVAINHVINFIAEFDLDDSYDHTFVCFNHNMNEQFIILIKHLRYLMNI